MLFIIAVILGIAAGILAKGKLGNLLDFRIEKAWVILCGFVLQTGHRVLGFNGFDFGPQSSIIVQGITYCLLFIGLWCNRHYLGIMCIAAGSGMNALVIMLNDGKMPVSYEVASTVSAGQMLEALKNGMDSKHALINEGTRLVFLSDIIAPPGILNIGIGVASVGDFVIGFGVVLLIFCLITGRKSMFFKRKNIEEELKN